MTPDIQTIQAHCDKIARAFRPEKIILFGSHAYGTPTPDSDVDVMVILPFEGRGWDKAAEILARVHPPFPMDLVVRTPRQIEERLAGQDWFITEIMEKGMVLHEAVCP